MASQITGLSIVCSTVCSFRRRSNKTSKLRVTGLCEGNPPVTGGLPSQRASRAKNISIWWCQCYGLYVFLCSCNIRPNNKFPNMFCGCFKMMWFMLCQFSKLYHQYPWRRITWKSVLPHLSKTEKKTGQQQLHNSPRSTMADSIFLSLTSHFWAILFRI